MTKRIKRSVVVALAVLLAVLPMITSAASTDSKLYIGMNLHFTGPTTTEGTFVASGAVEDSGRSQVTQLSLLPLGNQDNARLSGRQVYEGQQGTIVTRFSGIAGPLSSPHQVGRGDLRDHLGHGRLRRPSGARDVPYRR